MEVLYKVEDYLIFTMIIGLVLVHFSGYKMHFILTNKSWLKHPFGFKDSTNKLIRLFVRKILITKDRRTKIKYLTILLLHILGVIILMGPGVCILILIFLELMNNKP